MHIYIYICTYMYKEPFSRVAVRRILASWGLVWGPLLLETLISLACNIRPQSLPQNPSWNYVGLHSTLNQNRSPHMIQGGMLKAVGCESEELSTTVVWEVLGRRKSDKAKIRAVISS